MTELLIQDRRAPLTGKRGGNGKARADGVVLVSGNQLSRHLGISRQAVDALAAQQVVVRRSDGLFDQDESRLRYIEHLRTARRSMTSEAAADFTKAKAELIRLRIEEKQRKLIPIDEAIEVMDRCIGIVLTHMSGMAARCGGHDLALRRRIDEVVFQVRTEISEAASALADQRGEPKDSADDAV